MEDLKSAWKSARKTTSSTAPSTSKIIEQARAKKSSAVVAHYGNIGLLSFVAIMLTVTWYFFFPFRDLLSRVGVALMIGGLVVRIVIEIFSVAKSRKVNVSDATSKATEDTIAFFQFRRKIHGPVTLTIVALYIIGFYMLSPELSRYISTGVLVGAHASFLVGAVFVSLAARNGIRKEMSDLEAVIKLQKELSSGG